MSKPYKNKKQSKKLKNKHKYNKQTKTIIKIKNIQKPIQYTTSARKSLKKLYKKHHKNLNSENKTKIHQYK